MNPRTSKIKEGSELPEKLILCTVAKVPTPNYYIVTNYRKDVGENTYIGVNNYLV